MNRLNGMAHSRRSADFRLEPVSTIGRSGFGSVARRRSDLALHIASLDIALAADRALRDAGDAAGASLDAELAGLGMPASERRVEVARLRAQFNWKAAREADESERDLFRAARDELAYLERHWGRWHLDPQSGQVEFADESLRAAFERLRQAHAAAEAEQRRQDRRPSQAPPVPPWPAAEGLAAE
jgi:hypothetical protein